MPVDQYGRDPAPLRSLYGGSYTSSGSHNDTRLPLNKSPQTPELLGVLGVGLHRIEGLIGSQSGAATRFYEFETAAPSRIRLRPVSVNAFTSPRVQWALRRVDGGDGVMLEDLQLQSRNQEGTGQSGFLIQPGRFRVTVSTSGWYQLPFVADLDLREPVVIGSGESSDLANTVATLELDVDVRLNYPLLLPASGDAAESLGQEFVLDFTAVLQRTVLLPVVLFFSYVRDDYWEFGYAEGDGDSITDSELVANAILEITASLSVTTPSSP